MLVDVLSVDSVILPYALYRGKVTLTNYGPYDVFIAYGEAAVVGAGLSVSPNGGQLVLSRDLGNFSTADIHALHGGIGPVQVGLDVENFSLEDLLASAVSTGITQKAKVTLMMAQILDLYNTAIEIIPDPGTDRIINVIGGLFQHHFGTVDYPSNHFYLGFGSDASDIRSQISISTLPVIDPFGFGADSLVTIKNGQRGLLTTWRQGLFLTTGASMNAGSILDLALNDPGDGYLPGEVGGYIISDSNDAYFVPDSVDTYPPFSIIDGDQGQQWVKIAGNNTHLFAAGDTVVITGSTGNDGTYTLPNGANYDGGTLIVVNEVLPSPIMDGFIASQRGPIVTFTLTTPGSAYIVANGVESGFEGTGRPNASFDVLDVALGNGSLDVTVLYTIEDIS